MSPSLAEENPFKQETVLIVGMKFQELSPSIQQVFRDASKVEVELSPQWERYIEQSDADKVIIKQASGFIGLYNREGLLLRSLGMSPSQNTYAVPAPQSQRPNPSEYMYPSEYWHPTGYASGGRIDPYRVTNPPKSKANYQRLAPGWGYNREKTQASKKETLYQFLSFFPLDTVTPFNYPGTYDSAGISTAYGLGVIPHLGGLALEMRNARQQKEIYDANTRGMVPDYIEYPVQMTNPLEPENPITTDPNYIRMSPMPEAFKLNHPEYEERANYYLEHGKPLP